MTEPFTPPAPLKTAVLFLVFNRPDTTAQVFEAIRKARPPRLYVAADGPRAKKAGEAGRVQKVREIATAVDWPCEVQTLFRDENLGCKQAVSQAITWFFENEEQGIILEDDCLPSQSFFWFCEALLDRYCFDDQVFIISGYNKLQKWSESKGSYFYSSLGGIWGWASWKRAWKHFDPEMTGLENLIETGFFVKTLGKTLGEIRGHQLLTAKRRIEQAKMNTWAFPWGFTRHKHQALACVPSVSLIANIGFGEGATHTTRKSGDTVTREELAPPYISPTKLMADTDYDLKFLGYSRMQRIKQRLKSIISGNFK